MKLAPAPALAAAYAAVALAACTPMATAPSDAACAAHPSPAATSPGMPPAGHAQQMDRMREMHQRAATVKTPEERAAWMKDQMQVMQDSMAMMKQMHGRMGGGRGGPHAGAAMDRGGMAPPPDMMDLMMQMWTDREAVSAPPAR